MNSILIEKNNLNETLTKERETTSKQLETLGKVDAFKTSVTTNMGEYSQMIEKQQKFIDKLTLCYSCFSLQSKLNEDIKATSKLSFLRYFASFWQFLTFFQIKVKNRANTQQI